MESYAKSVEKFCETKGEGRKEEAVEELKEEEKGESKSNAARKKKLSTCTPTEGLRLCAAPTVFKVEMLRV